MFFLLLFIKGIEFICKLPLKKNILKIGLSIIISLFYINGSSITGSNVSRWSMIIAIIISFMYISRLYPKYNNKLKIMLAVGIVFAVSVGSLIKFSSANNGYNDLNGVIREELKYKTLNAYFAGNKNMQIALELSDDINKMNISKVQILISDFFANFPIANKYLSNVQRQSVVLFNYKYYNSTIACDQILPYSAQMYIYFNYFFVIIEIIQIYFSYVLYFKIKNEENFIKIYILVYLTFSFALINCINVSVILQNIWIHVLPAFLIYSSNIHLKKKRELKRES